ncbi:SGNH/GDSL hydrolase family protein [Labilibaculum sp. K2S]|uniref:SGNH/GDSL hydrolase family protein n=1 Tax=Labilibaculum sp. K2S TaxID=3056386 RepID=UPI0025A4C6B4|nr:SGNH/GDSL hydrolase family protein [Labilibaculum sp. K2S]MDM8158687.1 SGNH/GDSL hydrolase family protein [Labilibaculum sp. K2S]
MKKIYFFITAMMLFTLVSGQNKWQNIPATDPFIHYMGRVELQNDQARYNWPGVVVSAKFTGSSLGIHIKGGASNYFNVWIDDRPEKVLHAVNDTTWWYPECLEKGIHYFRLVKRTEADMGMVSFSGICIGENESLLKSDIFQERKLLFIGNSITCGYGAEGKDKSESFNPTTENCEKSYATIIARAFCAQYQLISHSGLGMVRNYGDTQKLSVKIKPMPARLDYLFDGDSTKHYDLSLFYPDAVVVNLGTNDFSTQPFPDEADFIGAGKQLIIKLRNCYPGVKIFCITGPMINEPCYSYTKKIVESIRTEMRTTDVLFLGIPNDLLNLDSDLGSDWHPSYRGQLKTANHIIPLMSTVLDWNYMWDELERVR